MCARQRRELSECAHAASIWAVLPVLGLSLLPVLHFARWDWIERRAAFLAPYALLTGRATSSKSPPSTSSMTIRMSEGVCSTYARPETNQSQAIRVKQSESINQRQSIKVNQSKSINQRQEEKQPEGQHRGASKRKEPIKRAAQRYRGQARTSCSRMTFGWLRSLSSRISLARRPLYVRRWHGRASACVACRGRMRRTHAPSTGERVRLLDGSRRSLRRGASGDAAKSGVA